jgi:hypothetical protein
MLIYGFHPEAARDYLESNVSPEVPEKLVTRLRKAIDYNQANSLPAQVGQEIPGSDVAGRWWTIWPMENRLRIKGTVRAGCMRVGLFVNDRLVKIVNTVEKPDDPQHRRVFRFNMKANILSALPTKTVLGVGSELGCLKYKDGGITYRHARLRGDGSLFRLLAESHFITKKGRLQRRLDQNKKWKRAALTAYTEFREYFESRFAYKAYIICGTLLGYFREGDFIAHDDDMDVAYFSTATTPEQVRDELKKIVFGMLKDGYDIKLARNRAFFKPTVNGFSFDVFPMWHANDCLWMMNTTRQRTGSDTIVPVQTGQFQGVEVYVPRNIERYIELEYGPDWRVPDPGYRSVGEPGTHAYLSGSSLSKDDVLQIDETTKTMAAEGKKVGQLSIADTDISAFLRSQ